MLMVPLKNYVSGKNGGEEKILSETRNEEHFKLW
jgi:hypothetical protein